MKQHIKGVVWPREPHLVKGKKVYRYILVGMLVTDEPLSFDEEVVLDCAPRDLAQSFDALPRRKPKCILGDATDVLLSLERI